MANNSNSGDTAACQIDRNQAAGHKAAGQFHEVGRFFRVSIYGDDYYRCERMFGSFSRSVELPVDVQANKVNASFKNGVLEIRLPKTEQAKKNIVKVKVA